jgi:magnesium transporter
MQLPFADTKVTVGAHPAHDHVPRESVQHANGKPGGVGGVAGNNSKLRKWLSVSTAGLASTLELSKIRVHHELGIQLRDLRLLDPMLASSYPSAVLARDRALVVNLEFIKMIITLDRVFITNLDDPNANMFIEELQRRLKHPAGSASAMGVTPSTAALGAQLQLNVPSQQQQNGSMANNNAATTAAIPSVHGNLPPATATPATTATTATHAQQQPTPLISSPHSSHPVLSSVHHPGLGPHFEELSFDLRVLECALDVVSGYLESQTADLEAAAHPALDALTLKISTSNLERVRRIKNRMVRLMTRAETLKELLEKLLDDDSDMKDLNLSAKEAEREELVQRQSLRHSISLSNSTPFDVPIPIHHRNNLFLNGPAPTQSTAAALLAIPESSNSNLNNSTFNPTTQPTNSTNPINYLTNNNNNNIMQTPFSYKTPGGDPLNQNADNSSEDNSSDEGVEVVEQLVEAYFMMVDNTCNKLQTLAEYIDDTEDFINIELDSHRNQLIRLDLVLTSATASIALITAVTSLFAMNVSLSPSFEDKAPYSWFVTIAVGTSVLAVVVFAAVMSYCRYKRLI